LMFVDTSALISILSGEQDAADFANRIERSPIRLTSALVILESAMRLSTMLAIEPTEVEVAIEKLLLEAKIEIMPIDAAAGKLAVQAFETCGKGRGHPAQLNRADCLSYACAKSRGVPILYKGNDFGRTDLA
jgi:ribonuclease VapC